jgi:hypothetical protein
MSLTQKLESVQSQALTAAIFSFFIFGLFFAAGVSNVQAQAIEEGFDNVANLPASGWVSTNRSQPLGASVWSQCGGTAIPPAHSGPTNSCILVNFNSATGAGTISNWLIAPNRTFNNGDTISFYTRTPNNNFPDRLQVRLSTNGASTNVGTTATDVGDFTTLLLDINPNYGQDYPTTWTQFTITLSGLAGPTSGRIAFRYFVEDGGPNGNNSNIIGLDTFVYTPNNNPPLTPGDAPVDFDGDGKTDWSVIRNNSGQLTWYYSLNGGAPGNFAAVDWGLAGDVFVPADYDGDQKDDVAVFRPSEGTWYILQSESNTLRAEAFGQNGDDASVIADYDGDGTDDLAVYRPGAPGEQSVWYILNSSNSEITAIEWGVGGDKPAPGDYDGDGKSDIVIARNDGGQLVYWMLLSGGSVSVQGFGLATDTIVTGDFDGDSKTDLAVVRNANGALNWYWRPSGGGSDQHIVFGSPTDTVAVGDYDGDAKADVAVWRDGNFWVRNSNDASIGVFNWGIAGDAVTASYNTH